MIAANIERTQQEIYARANQTRDPELHRLELQYHSVAEVSRNIGHFRDLQDDYDARKESNPKLPPLQFDLAERRWIRNERTMCRHDFLYWATRYAMIRSRDGQLVRYSPNISQRIIHTIRAESELAKVAIAFIQLKARQLGVSTDTEMCVLHRAQFYAQTNAVVASSDPDKSTKMAGMMERAFDNQPFYLKPNIRQVVGEIMEFPLQHSFISIQHGAQFTGISRGDTPQVAHLSELADFKNAEDLVDASLMRAMHDSPWMYLVLESTAAGRRNWWHRSWEHAKANWHVGRSRLRPVFLPWFVGTDLYPTETWLRARPRPFDWKPEQCVIAHAERARNYVRSNALLRKFLGDDWIMPLDQMWFYEVERAEHLAKDELNKFLQEMPADDLEAFQSSAISVFDTDTISWYRDEAGRRSPAGVYTIVGDDIPDRLRIPQRQWDTSKSPIEIKANWSPGLTYNYTLQPVLWDGYSTDDGLGKLYIYEHPQDGEEYVFGVDTADGLGQDRSVIEGLRKGDFHRNDFQCCEFASAYINAFDLWPLCMAIGSYYSVRKFGMLSQPRMAIECKGNGEATQNELKKRGWTNFHLWVRYDTKKIRKAHAQKLGVFTNYWFRTMMMDWIIKFLRDGWLDINTPWFVVEMEDLERGEEVQDLKACFLPGTKIMTWNPSRVAIESVPEGALVMTHAGNPGEVEKVWEYSFDGDAVRVNISGLPEEISCTPNHKFWGRKRTSKSLQGRVVRKEYPTSWIRADCLEAGDWVGVPKRAGLSKQLWRPEQLYAVGFWLAEGNYVWDADEKPWALEFTNTDKSYLERILAILQDWFPYTKRRNNQFDAVGSWHICKHHFGVRDRREGWKPVYNLIYYCREAASFFHAAFGDGASEKHLCSTFYNSTGLLPLVSGFIDGDGSQRTNQQHDVSINTTSEMLAWQLRQILLDSGIWCTIGSARRKPPRAISWWVNVKASYLSRLYPCKVKVASHRMKRMVIEDETHFYTPVTSVERFAYTGPVHDLSVQGDHTYTANGAAVHNTYGGHDDRIMAVGIALLSAYDTEIRVGGKTPGSTIRARKTGVKVYQTFEDQKTWQNADAPMYNSPMEGYLMAPSDRAWHKNDPRSYLFGGRPEPEERFSEYDI